MGWWDKVKMAFTEDADKPVARPVLPTEWPTKPTARYGVGLDCVGESHYVEALEPLAGVDRPWSGVAVLLPEPDNEHDPNAVGVYISGHKVGHLPASQAATMNRRILQDIAKTGVVAVEADVFTFSPGVYQVILEASTQGAMTRASITEVLTAAKLKPRDGDKHGFTMKQDGENWRVFCSGGNAYQRDEYTAKYSAALRKAGYKARVTSEDNYVFVLVTGLK